MKVTPDGARYLALVNRKPVPRPFCYRWLIPKVCGRSLSRWRVATLSGVTIAAVGTGLLAPDWRTGLAAAVMLAALPASRFNLRNPVLVDAPAMGVAVLAAVIAPHNLYVAVCLALVAGCMKETAPGFAALYAWNPVLLVGAVAPLARALVSRPGPDVLDEHNAWVLAHPIRSSWQYHRSQYLDGMAMVLPWGGAFVALGNLSWPVVVCIAVAYAQLLVATDTVRLYQWGAAPVVCVAAVSAVPPGWLPLLVALTVWNPWRGTGL